MKLQFIYFYEEYVILYVYYRNLHTITKIGNHVGFSFDLLCILHNKWIHECQDDLNMYTLTYIYIYKCKSKTRKETIYIISNKISFFKIYM